MSRAKAKARERALERAGYMHVSGWLPSVLAKEVKALIEAHRDAVEAAQLPDKP